MPPKKRKASDTNGTPKKKKMTEREKQEALNRAQAWAQEQQERKKNAPSVAAVAATKQAAAKLKKKSTSTPKKLTKQQQRKEAEARAAAWAKTELKQKTELSSPPPPPAPVAKKASSPKKKAAAATPKTKKKPTKAQPKSQQTPEAVSESPEKEQTAPKTTSGVFSKLKRIVAFTVLLVSLTLAVCSSCQFLPDSIAEPCFDACELFDDFLFSPGALLESLAQNVRSLFEPEKVEGWQQCHIFWAPSKLSDCGYGVFAAHDFKQNDIVELTPLYVPMEYGVPTVKNSVLDDYIYGYVRENTGESKAAVSLGFIMLNNHAVTPNMKWMGFGQEPTDENPDAAKAVGFTALRDIKAGEELFSSYGLDDGGGNWFSTRRLERKTLTREETMLSPEEMEQRMADGCSKSYAGYGLETFEEDVLAGTAPHYYPGNAVDMLHPDLDAGYGSVVAKVAMKAGDVAETAPGLLMHKSVVDGTPLAPLTFRWAVLGGASRITLRGLRETGKLVVQTQSQDTDWKRVDQWDGDNNMAILTLGSIAMMDRLGMKSEDANCRLEITGSGNEVGSPTVILRAVANRDIEVGDVLSLSINSDATDDELDLLFSELEETGQPL